MITGSSAGEALGSSDIVLANWVSGNTITSMVNTAGTHITLIGSPNPSKPKEAVTFTASVTASAPGLPNAPTGSVTFYVSAIVAKKQTWKLLGTSPLANGVATSSPDSALPAGTSQIMAVYGGDQNFNSNLSQVLNQTTMSVFDWDHAGFLLLEVICRGQCDIYSSDQGKKREPDAHRLSAVCRVNTVLCSQVNVTATATPGVKRQSAMQRQCPARG